MTVTAVDVAPVALFGVGAAYGRIEVLHGIDVAVPRHRVATLLGPNGAGKTTTLAVMSGLMQPTRGCRHVDGHHLNRARADQLARIGIRHIREGRSVYPNLTVRDNLTVAASAGATRAELEDTAFSLFPQLAQRPHQLAGNLSGGEKQMLALARGLGANPSVLLIDELSMGLAPRIVAELYETVARVAQAGVSVLVVEQFARVGLRYADEAYVMAHGTITYAGPSSGAEDAVYSAYLGTDR